MAILLKTVLVLLAIYVLALVAAFLGQRRLMYFPDRQRTAPAAVGLAGVVEQRIAAPDGHHVLAWYGAARPGQPTILYFHGNGGSLAARAPRIARFLNEGWGVMMMTYRGYGGSTGSPTEVDNVADALRTYDTLVARGVPVGSIVLYGESLGSGVAVQVAAAKPAVGLILDAPFTSTIDVAKATWWFFPVGWLLADRYESARHVAGVRIPLLVLHGELDQVIPVAMGRELVRLAPGPKRLVLYPNGNHSNLYVDGNTALDAVRTWISELPAPM